MSWFSRLRYALSPRRLDEDLAEEVRDHIERRAEDLRNRAFDEPGARRQAALVFGNTTRIRETCREFRLSTTLESSIQDVRYAFRGLLRSPSFAITAIASLGLAIGANTAIYSIVDAALLRKLPVPEADRLVTLATSGADPEGLPDSGGREVFSYPAYERIVQGAGDSARFALFRAPDRVDANAADAGESAYEEVFEQYVSPNAFEVLGVAPALGGLFSPGEDHYPGPRAVAVLSYDYWQRRFGGDPAVLGRKLVVDSRPFSVLGVAPKGFSGTEPGKLVDIWLPVTTGDAGIFVNDVRLFTILGRLAPHVSRERLTAQLQPAFQSYQEFRIGRNQFPPAVQGQMRRTRIVALSGASGTGGFRRNFSRPLWILFGVSMCMLLIAGANVAGLLLARSVARSGEMALRVSLGAGRRRLVRQLLTENLLISCLGGAVGWLLARAAAPALVSMVSSVRNPVQLTLALDGRVLLFCALVSAASALLFGFVPAWQASRSAPILELGHSNGQAGRLRIGRLFVGIQVALAFCLAAGGAGSLFSLRNLVNVDTGFDASGMTVLSMVNTPERDRQFPIMREMQARTGRLPGVQATATAWMAAFSGSRRAQRILLPGKAPSQQEETFYRVSPDYFATLRTPLLSGRDFTLQDNDDEPVPTVVNLAFARKYFGVESVLGKEFRRDDGVRHQIVGVAANSHFGSLRNGPEPIAYMPMKPPRVFTLYVRSSLDPGSVEKMVQREADTLGASLRARDVTTLDALVGSTIRTERLLAGIGGAFAILGLLLAATGTFGLLTYAVTRRTHEIGIRVALGAQRASIYALVLGDLLGTVAAGLMAGMAGALALMRLTQPFLFGIGVADPLVIGTACAVFAGVALIAAGLPAYRAAKLDPIAALRQD